MHEDGDWQRGHPRKTWWDYVKGDMEIFDLSCQDAQDRDQWTLTIKREPANPGLPGKCRLK